MQSLPEPLVLHAPDGSEVVIPGQVSGQGAGYYNLSNLLKGDETCVVFLREDGFTFSANELQKRKTAADKEYSFWGRNQWFATSVKVNSKQQVSINVFTRSNSGALHNITRSVRYRMSTLTDPMLREAYTLLFKAAYVKATGAAPDNFEQVAAAHIADAGIQSTERFLYTYAYPAAAEAEMWRRTNGFSTEKAQLRGFSRELEDYFKEPTWARAMQKLFGKHLPVEVARAFQPENVQISQLEGAYVVRSLVPPKDLLRYAAPAHREYELLPLADMRRALRGMPQANRDELLAAWRDDRMVVNAFASNVRAHARARLLRVGVKPLGLIGLQEVHTWGKLTQQFLAAYNGELEVIAAEHMSEIEQLRELMQASFESVPEDHIELAAYGAKDQWALHAWDMYNTNLPLISERLATQRYVDFHVKVFSWRRPFQHGSPLNEFHKQLRAVAPKTAAKHQMLRLRSELALPLMQQLIASLDSLLRRYGVARTPRNRTRLFVAAETFYNSAYRRRRPKMGKNFYAMIASDYPMAAVYEAHLMDMSPQEYAEFAQFPNEVRANLTGYNKMQPEKDWF